jgi:hypothetical protein
VLIYCVFNGVVLSYIMAIQNRIPNKFYFGLDIILLTLYSIFFIFVFILLTFQFRVVICNQTTSEYIKATTGYKNPFNRGCAKNISEFFCNINGYQSLIKLGETSRLYFSNILITEYFEDNKATELANTSINTTNISINKL